MTEFRAQYLPSGRSMHVAWSGPGSCHHAAGGSNEHAETLIGPGALRNTVCVKPASFQRLEEFQVDGYGNIGSHTTTVRDSVWSPTSVVVPSPYSVTRTQVTTTFQPSAQDVQDWSISLPERQTVEDEPRCAVPTGCPESIRSRTNVFTYYPRSDVLRTVTRQPGDSSLERTTELVVDALGNVEQIVESAAGVSRVTIIDYDEQRLFPVSITDNLDQTTQVRFDPRFGSLIARADPNGIDETWSYDDFGVLRHESGPESERSIDYEAAVPHNTGNPLIPSVPAAYRVNQRVVGGEQTLTEYNALGQPVEKRTTGLNGEWVAEQFAYHGRNLLAVRTRPHLADGSGDAQGAITYSYDELDRRTSVSVGDAAHTTRIAYAHAANLNFQYTDWYAPGAFSFKRTTDANQHPTVEVLDRDGRTIRVIDALGQATGYEYGAFGDLKTIVPPGAGSPVLSFDHDDFGRVTSSTDPAVGGTDSREYNGLDELTLTRDPLLRPSTFQYDELGRVRLMTDPDGDTSGSTTPWKAWPLRPPIT